MMKEIKKSGETRIVLDCAFDKIERILQQAQSVELVNDYYAYLITSLDLERLDLSPYRYIDVNITGFRMVDTTKPIVTQYLKKWNRNNANVQGQGVFHPLFVSSFSMKGNYKDALLKCNVKALFRQGLYTWKTLKA